MKHKLILFLILSILLYLYIENNLKKIELNDQLVSKILNSSNLSSNDNYNFISEFLSINSIEVKQPITILDKVFAYEKQDKQIFSYIQNIVIDKPRVYIYNTHANEMYVENTKSVIDASLLLQEKLNALGIQTIVESRNAYLYVKNNNLPYPETYAETRKYLTETLNEYKELDLIIDLHRDSVPKNSVIRSTINNNDYARVMYVMNKNLPNYKLADNLNNIIKKNYPNVSRGLYEAKDKYNQDLNEKVILLELGCSDNNFDEVSNSINVMAEAIKELINEY